MKNNLLCWRNLFLLSATLFGLSAKAQVATSYTFSQTAGTYTAVSGGTLLASAGIGNMDETVIPVTIPAFSFDGITYTSVNVSTNGFITFGSTIPQTDEYTPISGTDTYAGAISAFGADLDQSSGSGGKNIRAVQVGNEFVIQWQNVGRFITADKISFQIRLNTSTNEIKIVYGGTISPDNATDYLEVGLRGPDNTFATNVNNRKVVAATGSWINSVAGTSNGSTCYFNSTNPGTVPATGLTYTWTPGTDLQLNNLAFTTTNNCFSNNETVSATISNTGGSVIDFSVTPLTINASVSGTNPMTFTPVVINSGTLAINATQTIQIATGYDMSQPGATYNFNASLTMSGDVRTSNNSFSSAIQNMKPVANYSDVAVCSGTSVTLNGTTSVSPYTIVLNNSTALSIPDDDLAGVTSTIVVTDAGTALASSVTATIQSLTHTFTGDLTITLIAPDGSSVNLAMYEGIDANFTNTVFSDLATDPIYLGSNPFTGTFQPESPFSGLTGPANGTWQLHIVDDAAVDVGTLNSWSLSFLSSNSITAYSWSPVTDLSDGTISNPVATPASTTTYAVTVTDQRGCTSTDNVQVTINALPTVNAMSDAAGNAICTGSSVTLTSSGTATSYSWDNSVTEGMAFSPSATNTYTVTGTDANNCSNTASITVTVNDLPTVVANSSAGSSLCDGTALTLTGSGATSYNWDNSVADGTPFTPSSTNTYTVTGTDANGCSNTDAITVTVNTLPNVTASSSAPGDIVCGGNDVTLYGSGATSYTWDNGATDGVPTVPASTTTYTVTGMDANGCTNTASILITVNAPTVIASSNATGDAVCDGGTIILTGSGTATSYAWNNSVSDGVAFTPVTTNSYIVTGTDADGCTSTDTITVTVNLLPTVTASSNAVNDAVCDGNTIILTGGGAVNYSWDNSVIDGTAFTPASTNTYTVTGTDANGCSNTATIMVTVNPLPTVMVNSATICAGTATTLTASGATTYSWTPSGTLSSGTGATVTATPTGTTTYTVTGTQSGCSNTATAIVTVNQAPNTALILPVSMLCVYNNPITLTGGSPAGGTYSGNGVASGSFDPAAAGLGTQTITYSYTDGNGCTGSSTNTINVDACLGVEEETTSTLQAYPNPNTGLFTLSVNGQDQLTDIKIVDAQGKAIAFELTKTDVSNYSINMTNAVRGIYFLTGSLNNNSIFLRLEKQ